MPSRYPCDTHTHTVRCGHAVGRNEAYLDAAIAAGCGAIAVTDHLPLYWLPVGERDPGVAMAAEELPRYVETVLELGQRYDGRLEVLLGIEADFVAGHQDELAKLLDAFPFDVVLGSIHWIDGWFVDGPGSPARYRCSQDETDIIWGRYADAMISAAGSGLFDVLAHLDLPKKFGHRPTVPFAGRLDDVVAAIAASRCAVELSSAGRRKPVGEDYPSPNVVAALAAAGVPFVMGSDAHAPEEVGFGFGELARLAFSVGVSTVSVFRKRQQSRERLPGDC